MMISDHAARRSVRPAGRGPWRARASNINGGGTGKVGGAISDFLKWPSGCGRGWGALWYEAAKLGTQPRTTDGRTGCWLIDWGARRRRRRAGVRVRDYYITIWATSGSRYCEGASEGTKREGEDYALLILKSQ